MSNYLNLPTDLHLIRDGYRSLVEERRELVTDIEQEIIDRYTRYLPESGSPARASGVAIGADHYVMLSGYAVDPADALPLLARALRRAVAEVANWRLAQGQTDPMRSSEEAKGGVPMVLKFREDSREPFPGGWDRDLGRFDRTSDADTVPESDDDLVGIWGWG